MTIKFVPEGKAGRPIHLTPEIHNLIVEHVTNGVPLSIAAPAAGTPYGNVTRWLNKGYKLLEADRELTPNESAYVKFAAAISEARGKALAEKIAQVSEAGAGDWRAASWYLERQIPNEFGQVNRTELTGKDGGAIEIGQADIIKQATEIVQSSTKLLELEEGQ